MYKNVFNDVHTFGPYSTWVQVYFNEQYILFYHVGLSEPDNSEFAHSKL